MIRAHFENQIFQWLDDQNTRQHLIERGNLVNIAFHHMVRWYPQISNNGKDTYALHVMQKLENWEISQRAIDSFMMNIQFRESITRGELNSTFVQSTHPEHNISVDRMKSILLALNNPTLDDVRNCLNDNYNVVLISIEEKNVLNGNPRRMYQMDGQLFPGAGMRINGDANQRLEAIGAVVDSAQRQILIDYLTEKFGYLFN
jgi:hypothetical protein